MNWLDTDPAALAHAERGKRLDLLLERSELIARTEAFDRRWWRVAKCCYYASQTLALGAVGLFLASFSFSLNWPQWPGWVALMIGQAFGLGSRWLAEATLKRKLAAVDEMIAISDRMRAEMSDEEPH